MHLRETSDGRAVPVHRVQLPKQELSGSPKVIPSGESSVSVVRGSCGSWKVSM
jgi:hypothetical protein